MENEEDIKVDLKRYKGHHRKIPWALVIRIIVAAVIIGICIVLIKYVPELKFPTDEKQENDTEIEVEYEP